MMIGHRLIVMASNRQYKPTERPIQIYKIFSPTDVSTTHYCISQIVQLLILYTDVVDRAWEKQSLCGETNQIPYMPDIIR